ncbi:ribosome maturation factor RimM [Pseudonocardia oroxyli]|uniref:Ribosome maturation factor RimM n=1 Tax=Pseudonocardia oroxyli TaxID=366584 RepID=A0A1G7KHW4_PSEOR|nr:ribosome maturation factor RimM [Pseudonocardia oroxyli]SDF36614.1 16S rRNA processing protein RimM [Pseudonocardia oroxyli]
MSSTPTGRTPSGRPRRTSAGLRKPAPAAATSPAPAGDVLVGIVAKAHGLRGELAVEVRTDSPEVRFAAGSVLRARRPGTPDRTLTVEGSRPHSGRLLVRFREAPDRTTAEELRGLQLLLPAAELPAPEDPDEFHAHQLEGLRAELADGTVIGTVREVVLGPGGDLLAVAREGRPDALVPFVTEIVPIIDLPGGRVVVAPPEGLLDLDV